MDNLSKEKLNIQFNNLHSICSYLAMFPKEVPLKYIKKYTKEGDLIYDPFSGRGTTALESMRLNRDIFATDLSPLAYVISKTKVKPTDQKKAFERVDELKKIFLKNFKEINIKDEPNEIKIFYSENNLKQLKFLRDKIGKNWRENNEIDNYILAISLGIMHGQTRKTGDKNNSLYFSVNMPNGYSMSPNYAKNFIQKFNLHLIETDIFEQIKNRIRNKNNSFLKDCKSKGEIKYDNALHSSKYFIKRKANLIFTSPPYLNLVKYIDQNWIRFWLLGKNKEELKKIKIDDNHNKKSYLVFLKNFFNEMEKIIDKNGKLIMVIGDVHNIKIIEIINECLYNVNFKLIEEPIKQELKNKLSRSMGKKIGKATKFDWIFIMEKING